MSPGNAVHLGFTPLFDGSRAGSMLCVTHHAGGLSAPGGLSDFMRLHSHL
jgi:hypothetical protein